MAKNIRLRLAGRIRTLRAELELTQDELARRAGISIKYLQNLEGKEPKNATIETLEKIAYGFDMPVWELLKFEK